MHFHISVSYKNENHDLNLKFIDECVKRNPKGMKELRAKNSDINYITRIR